MVKLQDQQERESTQSAEVLKGTTDFLSQGFPADLNWSKLALHVRALVDGVFLCFPWFPTLDGIQNDIGYRMLL